jgi:DNA polymerase-3 subunit chi
VTQIDFYVQVTDKAEAVRKLCGKALAAKSKLFIWTADSQARERLSRQIWSSPSTGFVPHCPAADPLAPRTPVILDSVADVMPHTEVLINLRGEVPPFFSRFERLIEIVGENDEDKHAARDRYRYYRDRGYEIRTHDMSMRAQGSAVRQD